MKRLATTLGLLALLTLTFSAAPHAWAAANGDALIARGGSYTRVVHNDGSQELMPNGYTYFRMSAAGKLTAFTPPAVFSRQIEFRYNSADRFIALLIPPSRIEVVDTFAGSDTFYPLPADSAINSGKGAPTQQVTRLPSTPINGGKQLLLNGLEDYFGSYSLYHWYILDIASGQYATIDTSKNNTPGYYYPFAQSPADGLIYAERGCRCDAPYRGELMRYDLQGNGEAVDLHLGKYLRATAAQMSPAGKYLYFLALDPDQPHPTRTGPGVDPNIILRYRLSDGNLSVVARATANNVLGSYTLTSPDDYLTYSEYTTMQDNQYEYHATGGAIKRVNLATNAKPQTLVSGASLGEPQWCGKTLYYTSYVDESKPLTFSYNLTTRKTAQVEGFLVGCAP